MARLVFLDAGPLGIVCAPPGKPKADSFKKRFEEWRKAGIKILIPEIADYEVRRELIRDHRHQSILRLNELRQIADFVLIQSPAILKAADLWATLRNQGLATADNLALDGDAIFASQVLTAVEDGDEAIVATSNAKHMRRFGLDARLWEDIEFSGGAS